MAETPLPPGSGDTGAEEVGEKHDSYYTKWKAEQKQLKAIKGTGMMPPWAMGVYFFFTTVGFILLVIGMAYAWRCSTSVGKSHEFLNDYCCRDGTEPGMLSGNISCAVGKTDLNDRLEAGDNNLPTTYIFWTGLTAVMISSMVLLALTCWIAMAVYTANYRRACLELMNKSYREGDDTVTMEGNVAQEGRFKYYVPSENMSKPISIAYLGRRVTLLVGFIIPLALGIAVLPLASLNYGYTAFEVRFKTMLGTHNNTTHAGVA